MSYRNGYDLFLVLFFSMIIGNLISFICFNIFNTENDKFFDNCIIKMMKYFVILLWILVNLAFLTLSAISWLICMGLQWYTVILCILWPIEIFLDIFCCSCCSRKDDNNYNGLTTNFN